MKAVVTTDKHYNQWTLATVTPAGTKTEQQISHAVSAADKDTSQEVVTGSVVKAVFVELWITSDDTSGSSFVITLEKVPGGVSGFQTYAQSIALQGYNNKKNVLYTTMGLVGPNDEVPIRIMHGWFKIPKGKQRMGQDDYIVLNISAISNGLTYCGFSTFKEYT